jgi:hypothetical protein
MKFPDLIYLNDDKKEWMFDSINSLENNSKNRKLEILMKIFISHKH